MRAKMDTIFALMLIVFVSVQAQSPFVPDNYEEVTKEPMGGYGAQEKCGEGADKGLKICVPYHRCDPHTNTTLPDEDTNEEDSQQELDYSFIIDVRLGEANPCPDVSLGVCCKIRDGQQANKPTTERPIVTPDDNTKPTPTPKPRLSYCGIRNENGVGFKITGNTQGEAEYGEFPWMVAILKTFEKTHALCGGSLIAPRVVLTAAHCVQNYTANDLKARAGEWDTLTENEKYPYQEQEVEQIIVHEKFTKGVLYNDVALLILKAPYKKARHIGTICLPEVNEVIDSKACYATGWGKNFFGAGEFQVILKKIELPTVPRKKCEDELKASRLGNRFRLNQSFMCAGGVEGKDTCTGDGGSPLVCPDPKNPERYVQAGIVAWGIGCGTTVPGVYADVAKFRSWVDGHMQRLELSNVPYTV